MRKCNVGHTLIVELPICNRLCLVFHLISYPEKYNFKKPPVQSCVLFVNVVICFKGRQDMLNNFFISDFDTFKEVNLLRIFNCRDWAE